MLRLAVGGLGGWALARAHPSYGLEGALGRSRPADWHTLAVRRWEFSDPPRGLEGCPLGSVRAEPVDSVTAALRLPKVLGSDALKVTARFQTSLSPAEERCISIFGNVWESRPKGAFEQRPGEGGAERGLQSFPNPGSSRPEGQRAQKST